MVTVIVVIVIGGCGYGYVEVGIIREREGKVAKGNGA